MITVKKDYVQSLLTEKSGEYYLYVSIDDYSVEDEPNHLYSGIPRWWASNIWTVVRNYYRDFLGVKPNGEIVSELPDDLSPYCGDELVAKSEEIAYTLVPDYVTIVGSVAKGIDEANDIDILVRDFRHRFSIEKGLTFLVEQKFGKKAHLIVNPSGPHGPYEPLFDLALVPYKNQDGVIHFDLVLKAKLEEKETRGERALENWEKNWVSMLPRRGGGRWVYQHHWRGLTEEEAKNATEDDLFETSHSLHGDLRLDSGDFLHGWTIFLGRASENKGQDKFLSGRDVQFAPKLPQPKAWLNVGVSKPYVSEPGDVGATSQKWSKFFAVDRGAYRLGVARKHFVEYFLIGSKIEARVVVQYADFGGRRAWVARQPEDQTPYALKNNIVDVIREVKQKKQGYLIWSDGKRGPYFIDVDKVSDEELEELGQLKPDEVFEYLDGKSFAKKEITPVSKYTPMKPKMLGYTDFPNVDELWERWAKDRVENGLMVSPKIDGFRTILQRNGDEVSIRFEDFKEERREQLPEIAKEIPDGAILEGELVIKAGDKWLIRPQILNYLAGVREGREPYVFLYEVVAWDGEYVGDQPFAERYSKYLSSFETKHLKVAPQWLVDSESELRKAAKRAADWDEAPNEGVIVREANQKYTTGATDTYVKVKKALEIKVQIMEKKKVEGGWVYLCGYRDGNDVVPIGNTFRTELDFSVGTIVDVLVEEILLNLDNGEENLSWGKPTLMGPTQNRSTPYTKAQIIDLARRYGVLKEYVRSFYTIYKTEPKYRYTLGVVYAPGWVDAHGEASTAEELFKASLAYINNRDRSIYLEHDQSVRVGEWVHIVQWPYPVEAELMLPTGEKRKIELPADSLYLGVIWDEVPWKELVLTGKIRGFSFGGVARRVLVDTGGEDVK